MANLDPRGAFFQVNFEFPVDVDEVEIVAPISPSFGAFAGDGTLTFSNGFTTSISLDSSGAGATTFAMQTGIESIRLEAGRIDAGSLGPKAGLREFRVGGAYDEKQFTVREGDGRLFNNRKAAGVEAACDLSASLPPVIETAPPISATVGQPYVYPVSASDPEGATVAYSLVAAPTGMTIDPLTGLIEWTPTADQAGPQTVTVRVDDGAGGVSAQTFIVNVAAEPGVNRAPSITSVPGTAVTVGDAYAYDAVAIDPDGDLIFLALLSAPSGASLDSVTGALSWSPTPTRPGNN